MTSPNDKPSSHRKRKTVNMAAETHELLTTNESGSTPLPQRDQGYILCTDFGSTTLNVKVFTTQPALVAEKSAKVPYLKSESSSAVEIDPEELFSLFVQLVKDLFSLHDINPSDVVSSGFTFQKGTFMLWNKGDGKPRSNLISWQDTRCADLVKWYNNSYLLKALNVVGALAYTFTRKTQFLLLKILRFETQHSSMRLKWLLNEDACLMEDAKNANLCYGTLDTWIMWKLSKGRHFVTDYSCASGSALFDPFSVEWSAIIPMIIGIPVEVFPNVVNTSGTIGKMDPEIFGASIPVNSLVADCQAGAFALNCLNPGEFSFIMGTGCFIDINTGSYGHASIAGLYPQIGWRIGDELTYLCEGHISGIAASVEWTRLIGLFDDVTNMSQIASSVESADGVFYVPAFHGLSAPHQDPTATAIFIGMKPSTTKAHLVRAVLEGIAFRFVELYFVAINETRVAFQPPIKIGGGVSNNEFLMQMISSLTNCVVEKSCDSNVSVTGALYLAGLGAGIWRDLDEIRSIPKSTVTYYPDESLLVKYEPIKKQWLEAVKRCKHWKSS